MAKLGLNGRRNRWGYFFITPFTIAFILFGLYPIIYTFQLSFQKWNGFSAVQYVAFQNWLRLANDSTFPLTLKNTLKIWLCDFVPQLGIALFLAMIFTFKKVKGVTIFRAVFYLPNLITAASISFFYQRGLLNPQLLFLNHRISLKELHLTSYGGCGLDTPQYSSWLVLPLSTLPSMRLLISMDVQNGKLFG